MTIDGGELVSFVLGGDAPYSLSTRGKRTVRRISKGGREPLDWYIRRIPESLSHEARMHWPMTQQDAEDIMSMESLLHRRLDSATMLPRV